MLLSESMMKLFNSLLVLVLIPLIAKSFKALKLYKEGTPFYISVLGVILSSLLIIFTLFFAFKTFKTLLDALFSDK